MRAVISTGSNMGDSIAHLRSVTKHFAADKDTQLVATSAIYSSPAWGKTDQDGFLNQVMIIKTDRSPEDLLRECQELERQAGRVRLEKWGPRTLDVDIIEVLSQTSEVISDDAHLTLPHPEAKNRAFVLVPWLSIEPQATLSGQPLSTHLEALDPEEIAAIKPLQD
ncbi:2-amino-4-hydroxy-6-hydroxymethyldihydropteridine diphosphokinase [Corynebacterium caspium]|uniref:2-amino-4-hydroxy-6- hydroxymethyldihydropteridine diphosphokinase n=1 Tax=Corynebacterium caspium TaxID=234828 RepID=UPI0004777E4A|nr:2-amino-4-hydroxy-6-hydroxymethyldihydropteridine diphosphokinase [Corynebacterium caspium]